MLDIGCYPITMSRFMFGAEPERVAGTLEIDPDFGTDRAASAVMEFPSGQAIFTCSTQQTYYQRMQLLGTTGRIEVEIPFNAPADRPTRLFIDNGGDLSGGGIQIETIPACDQYTIQGDLFSKAIAENGEVAVPLEDAIANMRAIDAIFLSAKSGGWERP